MADKDVSIVELARRNGCDDIQVLAQIERAEYISELIHTSYGWVSGKLGNVMHEISALFHRHAH